VTLSQTLLWPLTLPYGAVLNLRARAYRGGLLRQKRLDGIVISVGNLTTGGTGKTPMVLWIAERLLTEGKRVGILTRGYRGKTAETQLQPAETAVSEPATTVGNASSSDEVQLLMGRLGERVAFGVGADRFARGTELAKKGVEWFVLDDGFQHLQLTRDVNIVLIDATNPFGGGYLLPAGRLREPRTALARADIIVITRSDYTPALEATIRRYTAAPVFHARAQLDSISSVDLDRASESPTNLKNEKLFAFCGIGNGPAFVNDLRDWGYSIAGSKFFPDHHRYSQQDANAIEAAARGAGATTLICTEKDKYNLAGVRWRTNSVSYCRISFQVSREDEFWAAIKTKAASRPAAAR
jgi:tetraacyldisaccharide 4'-kinase